jgi:hypothetical protein
MPASVCAALLEAREHDPFSVLGLHAEGAGWRLRVFRPHAKAVAVEWRWPVGAAGAAQGDRPVRVAGRDAAARPWRLDVDGVKQYDAYAFVPQPPADDLFLFNAGRLRQAWRTLRCRAGSSRRHCRRLLPGLGAECRAGFGGGRLQWLGRSRASDGHPGRLRRLGAVRSRTGGRRAVSLRAAPARQRRGEAQERPLCARLRTASGLRLLRDTRSGARMERRRVDAGEPAAARPATGCRRR